ncbi:NAD(P)/FAD-dependent oxidoreductase [Terracoccus luteus]|uniref:Isorenieratene synthase n=1 Tax=Terracoccus luteus TaxID=53356 RepID=A0A839PRA7_9MICO|nr:NAD(P)/FAD-dependent oxidoreductase [Terracoccus luteus]MBB2986808.1 isorenieratene synthase [Terracoccus luteus]MCP2172459.1 isorenieratene synthase [Terracoccus luteus]
MSVQWLPTVGSARRSRWLPGLDPRAVRHAPDAPHPGASPFSARGVVVVGGGIAGLTAATGLAERGVPVTLVEREPTLGGRVRSWPVAGLGTSAGDGATDTAEHAGANGDGVDPASVPTMSRGFHAFFRQYYNLRALLRRSDPGLERLVAVDDYPLTLADGPTDSFAAIPRTPPLSIAAFVVRSPSFPVTALRDVDISAALGLLDVRFPETYTELDGVSASDVLDRLRFPQQARHLALEVFARSFFADPRDFSGGELVAMFHTYFTGSAEGLLFDVPDAPYDEALWAPLGRYLHRLGVTVETGRSVTALDEQADGVRVTLDDGRTLEADAVVLATDRAALQRLVDGAGWLGADDPDWRARLGAQRIAPPFVVWRLWLDRPAAQGSPPFLGTSGYGPLDNVSFVEQMEPHASRWADATDGTVVELHAYAVPPDTDETALRDELTRQLHRLHPELVGATVVHDEWLWRDDCPLAGTDPWADRPGVETPDPRVVLAGDGIRCPLPVALMERAATTGWTAANVLLARHGLAGHDVWSVPLRGRGQPLAHAARRALAALPR